MKFVMAILATLAQLALIVVVARGMQIELPARNVTAGAPAEDGVVFVGTDDELRTGGLGAFATSRPNDDPEKTLEIIKKATDNQLSAEMVTNKTRAFMSCETGAMIVKLNFTEPFRGVVYADYDRRSPCKFFGEGDTYYEMRLPLKGCGTMQESPRLFVNNIVIRFHRSFEFEDDEIKTIVCKYPPPQVQAPPPPPIGPPARV